MSLPSILKLKVIYPNKVNYINTNEITFNFWKEQFSSLKKYKVGFVYNGLSSCFIENEIPLINFEIFQAGGYSFCVFVAEVMPIDLLTFRRF